MGKEAQTPAVAPLAGSVDRNVSVCFATLAPDTEVAPLAGSVDRNTTEVPTVKPVVMSLPSRGAWIEILHSTTARRVRFVAPLAGSVDRNYFGYVRRGI